MARQSLVWLNRRFQADPDYAELARLFRLRAEGYRVTLPEVLERELLTRTDSLFTLGPASDQASVEQKLSSIRSDIFKFRDSERVRLGAELSALSERRSKALEQLKLKPTKKAQNDLRISEAKMSKAQRHLAQLELLANPPALESSNQATESALDSRLYPLGFSNVLIARDFEDAKRALASEQKDEASQTVAHLAVCPMRYQMRPHNKSAEFDQRYSGCYNARVESLTSVPWWSESLKQRRGILVTTKFFENVRTTTDTGGASKSEILSFVPHDHRELFFPVLWDQWEHPINELGTYSFYSFAVITRSPNPEVLMAGHDRTPIHLSESQLPQWLNKETSAEEALQLLENAPRTRFRSHSANK